MSEPLFTADGFTVTHNLLRTPRRAYELRNVEMVTVRQPLLLVAGGIGTGLLGFTLAFWRYLYGVEIVTLFTVSVLAIVTAAMFGTLRVHSLAMRGDEGSMIGRIGTLRGVKDAVEKALSERA